MQMGALGPQYPPAAAAVRFLENGGDMVIVSHDLEVADAAYDAWYVYQTCAPRGGIAAVPPQPTCASRLRTRR